MIKHIDPTQENGILYEYELGLCNVNFILYNINYTNS